MSRLGLLGLVLAIGALAGVGGGASADDSVRVSLDPFGGAAVRRSNVKPYPRLAAEFERPRALLLSVGDWQSQYRYVLTQIAEKTRGHVNLIVLCNDTWQIKDTTGWLLEVGQEFPHVYFCEMPVDTVWLRDFGPLFAQTHNGTQTLDFLYEHSRPKDDALPAVWSRRSRTRHVPVPWSIQGGNLISNGQGLAVATNRIFADNQVQFSRLPADRDVEVERRKLVAAQFSKACNLSQLIVLEPLESELTQHVDMLATFLSADDVLVARLDPQLDPVNAEILDRNAQRLQQVIVGNKPLRVHRIEIPVRQDTSWSAYTNAVIASDLVLMPVFDTDPDEMVAAAVAQYQSLLPRHTIQTVDMSSMKQLQGELHCLSLHVPWFVPLPDRIYPFANSKRAYFPQ